MMQIHGLPSEPGSYTVLRGDESHQLDDVTFRYGDDHELVAVRDGETVAVFRWWDAVMPA